MHMKHAYSKYVTNVKKVHKKLPAILLKRIKCNGIIDPLGQPTVVITIFAYVSVRTSFPTSQNLAKQNKRPVKRIMVTRRTVGLAEKIIDDTCLVTYIIVALCMRGKLGYIGLPMTHLLLISFIRGVNTSESYNNNKDKA